ncbi:MAG: hypothetical protein KAU22_02580 [Desulfuromonadales bacterium]|nr:hypothetical protein [Desulfuromonadales bacterium]
MNSELLGTFTNMVAWFTQVRIAAGYPKRYTAMKIQIIAIVSFLLFPGCLIASSHEDQLNGVWTSDKEMTLAHLDQSLLSESQNAFLQKSLGELQFIFKGNQTAVNFTSFEDEPLDFENFKIISSTQSSVSIESSLGIKATYHFSGNCFYLINNKWKYKEYFCREE